MELGMIGLGRMGANMTERLVGGGHRVISYDRNAEAIQRVVDIGGVGAHSLADFALGPIFKTLPPPDGYLHVAPNGAGHFVKMIHNGIEYGMLQAYAEGFELLNASRQEDSFAAKVITALRNEFGGHAVKKS